MQFLQDLRPVDDLLAQPVAREEDILRLEEALTDPRFHTVAELAEALGMSPRTMERFCSRVFGFSPQLLLRRQIVQTIVRDWSEPDP